MPPAFQTLAVEEHGTTCYVSLVRPTIDLARIHDLELLGDYLQDDSPSEVVVFRGAAGTFCEGIDLADFSHTAPPDVHGFNKWERCLHTLERLHKVTLAVIEGDCLGGGLQLALACDCRLASTGARLGLDEVRRGFLPGMATWRLARHLGVGRARRMVLGGRPLTAADALTIGLVEEVCAPDEVPLRLQELIDEMTPVDGTLIALARRLLIESAAKSYETFLGDFLAAQHKAVNRPAFRALLQPDHGQHP